MDFKLRKKIPHIPESIYPVMTRLALEHNAINLAQGFPGFGIDKELMLLVDKYTSLGKNQYAPILGVPELRENLSKKMELLYGYVYKSDTEICITAGATQGIFTAVSAVVNKGDEVIIIDPAFESYEPVVKFNGGEVRRSPLKEGSFEIDWDDIRSKISEKTRMLIINTPQNPTGKLFTEKDIENLRKTVLKTDIIILSDEVYEHIVFDGKKHESISKYPDLAERSFVVYSLGKTYHVTGWRLGYVCAPEQLMREFVRAHQYQVYSVPTPLQYALSEYILKEEKYLELSCFFQEKRDFFLKCLEGSQFIPVPCSGSYFQLLNYSAITQEDDVEFAKRLTIENKVASIPISLFYETRRQDQLLRFCFAKEREDLERGAERLHNFK